MLEKERNVYYPGFFLFVVFFFFCSFLGFLLNIKITSEFALKTSMSTYANFEYYQSKILLLPSYPKLRIITLPAKKYHKSELATAHKVSMLKST